MADTENCELTARHKISPTESISQDVLADMCNKPVILSP